MNKILFYKILFVFFLFQITLFAQDSGLFAGIEIGSKGIKMSVLDIKNIKKGDFIIKESWSENVGIVKGVSIDGNLALEDMEKATSVVLANYLKIKTEFKVPDDNVWCRYG